MELVKRLSSMIEEEIDGACAYIKCAIAYKEDNKELADVLYSISLDEIKHTDMLNAALDKVVRYYEQTQSEEYDGLMMLYDYLQDKYLDQSVKVKVLQGMFKG